MTSLKLRSDLAVGAAVAVWLSPAAAQTDGALTLDDALTRSGVIEALAGDRINPRIVGPQEDIAAARALVGQAGLRPNPEVSLEAENFAGTGEFSGVRAIEYTLAARLPIERGNKRQARVQAAGAELAVAELRGELALTDLGRTVRERYIAAVAAEARAGLAQDILERSRELARIAGVLVDVGREPPLRALRAQSELAEAEAELKAAQAEALGARFALGALWSAGNAPPVPTTFPDIEPPLELLARQDGLQVRLAAAERAALQAASARERSLR